MDTKKKKDTIKIEVHRHLSQLLVKSWNILLSKGWFLKDTHKERMTQVLGI